MKKFEQGYQRNTSPNGKWHYWISFHWVYRWNLVVNLNFWNTYQAEYHPLSHFSVFMEIIYFKMLYFTFPTWLFLILIIYCDNILPVYLDSANCLYHGWRLTFEIFSGVHMLDLLSIRLNQIKCRFSLFWIKIIRRHLERNIDSFSACWRLPCLLRFATNFIF